MQNIIPGTAQGQGPFVPFACSLFSFGSNPNPTPGPGKFSDLVAYLDHCAKNLPHPGPRSSLGAAWHLPENKKDWSLIKVEMPAWSPAVFNGTRENTAVQAIHALVFDFDDITPAELDAFLARRQANNLACCLYETPSRPKPGTYRLRAVIPTARALSRQEFPNFRRAGLALLGATATTDTKTKAPSNQFFVPCQRDDGTPAYLANIPGEPLDPQNLPYRAAISLLHQSWPPGTRNSALMAIAGACAMDRMPEAQAHDFLVQVSDDDPQISTIVPSTYAKYQLNEPITGWLSLSQIIGKPIVDQARDFLGSTTASTAPFQRGDHTEIAQRLLRELGPTTVHDEGKLWTANPVTHLFEPVTSEQQATIIGGYAGDIVARSGPLHINWSDITGSIHKIASQSAKPGFFAGADPSIVFTNCTLTLDPRTNTLVTRPHDANNRARAGYPFPYDPQQYPHQTLKFLVDTFSKDQDTNERIQYFQEFVGLCIFGRATPFETATIFYSDQGGTAKSTTVNLALGVMPEGTVSTIPPQLWGDQYRRAQLAGMRLNAVNELPDRDILDAESFKAIISGEKINARQIREKSFDFKPIAGHIFATNKLPPTPDVSSAFFRRLVVFKFTRVVPEKILDYSKHLLAFERPQLVAWFAQGATRALQRGALIHPASSALEVTKWKGEADSVSMFVREICEKAEHDKDWTSGSKLYTSYRGFCEGGGFKPVNIRNFSQRLGALEVKKDHKEANNVYGIRVKRHEEFLTSAHPPKKDLFN